MSLKRVAEITLGLLVGLEISGATVQPIVSGKDKSEQGIVYRNPYYYAGVLNPGKHDGMFRAGDFRVLPRTRPDGERTLDENEAMIRFFVHPEVRVFSVARKSRSVAGNAAWEFRKQDDGADLSRNFGEKNALLQSSVKLRIDPKRAIFEVDAAFVNSDSTAYNVEFSPAFAVLTQELYPLKVVVPRQMVRYQIGGPVKYWRSEETSLDGNYKNYWWRKVVDGGKVGSGQNLYLERIVFSHPKVLPPVAFGLMELRGNAALLWDLKGVPGLDTLEMRWQKDVAVISPEWRFELAAGARRQIKFRVLTIKGLSRFDNIEGQWVFAYQPSGNFLQVRGVPLSPHDRLSINMNVNDSRGTSLANQSSEVAAMTPFSPGRLDYRVSIPFQAGERYPIKLVLNSIQDNSRLLEVSGTVTP